MENERQNHKAALARQEDLVVQELPDEVMVYDLKRHKAHCLNKTAAFVWHHCDGQTPVTMMAGMLQEEFGSPVDEQVVWYALDKLDRANLLAEKVDLPVMDGLSRRRMIRRMGTMIVLPAVISLVAPTVAQAVTVVTTSKKVADGTCNTPPGPPPNPNCLTDTCCTGSGRLCVGSLSASSCSGTPCVPLDSASECNQSGLGGTKGTV
jgi:hypothetical protein